MYGNDILAYMRGVLIGIFVIVVVAIWFMPRQTAPVPARITIGDTLFSVRIAQDDADRARGLSGTAILGTRDGMLFIFPASGRHGIWMKDMLVSIDILWFDDERRLIDHRDGVAPETYPEVFRPAGDARYVLEVAAGVREELGIALGAQFAFE